MTHWKCAKIGKARPLTAGPCITHLQMICGTSLHRWLKMTDYMNCEECTMAFFKIIYLSFLSKLFQEVSFCIFLKSQAAADVGTNTRLPPPVDNWRLQNEKITLMEAECVIWIRTNVGRNIDADLVPYCYSAADSVCALTLVFHKTKTFKRHA